MWWSLAAVLVALALVAVVGRAVILVRSQVKTPAAG
jgi:hypothetical protein